MRSDSPSLGDGSSSTHTTMTEDGSNTSADRPRRIHSVLFFVPLVLLLFRSSFSCLLLCFCLACFLYLY